MPVTSTVTSTVFCAWNLAMVAGQFNCNLCRVDPSNDGIFDGISLSIGLLLAE